MACAANSPRFSRCALMDVEMDLMSIKQLRPAQEAGRNVLERGSRSGISDVQQSVEECTVTLQGQPQVLSGYILSAIPLLFQCRSLVGETCGQAVNHGSDQLIGFLYGP